MSENKQSPRHLANSIAAELGEKGHQPRVQIRYIIQICGAEFVQDILQQTLEAEAGGGMATTDGERRRTRGGIFFFLAKEKMTYEQRGAFFKMRKTKKKDKPQPKTEEKPKKEKSSKPKEPSPEKPKYPGLSPEQIAKLTQLETAVQTFQKRINELNELPPDKRQALSMTERLLANTKKQIDLIMAKVTPTE